MWLLWLDSAYAGVFAVWLVTCIPIIRPRRPTPTRTRRTPEER